MQTVAASLGWGGNPLRLAEVPEAFWQTVSPEVHSQINEFLFEQVCSSDTLQVHVRLLLEASHSHQYSVASCCATHVSNMK